MTHSRGDRQRSDVDTYRAYCDAGGMPLPMLAADAPAQGTAERAFYSLAKLRERQIRLLAAGRDVPDLPAAAIALMEAAIRGEPVNALRLEQAAAEAQVLTEKLGWAILKAHAFPSHAA
jgi:hypothetical protein